MVSICYHSKVIDNVSQGSFMFSCPVLILALWMPASWNKKLFWHRTTKWLMYGKISGNCLFQCKHYVSRGILSASVCSFIPMSCHWAPIKSLALYFLATRYLYTLILLSLLFSRLNSTSSLNLSWYERCSTALMIFMPLGWTCSSKSMSLIPGWGRLQGT